MHPILARCGNRCDLCLAYRPNIEKNPSNQQKLSDGWFKYFGFRIEPADIICNGCLGAQPESIDLSCPIRPCVIEKGFDSCAHCDEYVCEKFKERIVVYEDIKNKLGNEIPADDYICFIQPYENKRRLDILLSTGEIIT